ncbi:Zn-dependent alcohol dehydrogenase [Mycobacteroides abscessus subsp. bolletii]|nr:Zn-dependent alcohol dehydrogenase [Mycobacteroides abscessus subsp. bolletii]
MTLSVPAYAAYSPTEPLRPTVVERREPGPKDIVIDIVWAGICHSDIHTVSNHWGPASFPVVPGHEIAGVVTQVGPEVEKFKVGDRAGVGCMVGSCGECANCKSGEEQFCNGEGGFIGTYYAVGKDGRPTYGGYSDLIVVDEGFALKIPDASPRSGRPAAVRRNHHVLPATSLEGRTRNSCRHHWPWWPRPYGCADRPRARR